MASYLPLTDAGLLNWSANFNTQLDALTDPTIVGLTSAQATQYASAQSAYDAAYTAATDPSTRGKATVFAKNEAKKSLVAISREFAMAVTNHPGVTDQQRLDFGLTVRDTEPTPVPPPSTSPTIDVLSVDGWTFNLRLHNGDSTSRAKPEGVKGATVFSYVGDQPPVDVDDWKFEGSQTRTEVTIEFPTTLSPGTKVWITAFWFNPTSQSGPAAMPISRFINYGNMSQAA